ncbi:hypothetical protein APUTEX25_003082, partial [Auxenochlorella protothecoides]
EAESSRATTTSGSAPVGTIRNRSDVFFRNETARLMASALGGMSDAEVGPEPPQYVTFREAARAEMLTIRTEMTELRGLHGRATLSRFDESNDDEIQVEVTTQQITKLFRRCEARLQKFGSVPSENEADEKALQADTLSALIDDRDREVAGIVASIHELAQIMKDLSVLVIDQGTVLDRIDYNMEATAAQVTEGVKQLAKAEKKQKQGLMAVCIMFLLVAIGILVLFVVIKAITDYVKAQISGQKGEVRRGNPTTGPEYHLFAVFDGHNGDAASTFAQSSLVPVLEAYLPVPEMVEGVDGAAAWAGAVQEAMVKTLLEIDRRFAARGATGGTTATLVLQIGQLVTCASVGNSRAVLDTGAGRVALTREHVVASNPDERERLLAAGCTLARLDVAGGGPAVISSRGTGPLRVWPGGVTLSRSLGDFSVGPALLAVPHVVAVMLPPAGGRIVLASDAVWKAGVDAVLAAAAAAPAKTAAHAVLKALGPRLRGDASDDPQPIWYEDCVAEDLHQARADAPTTRWRDSYSSTASVFTKRGAARERDRL